MRLLIVCTPKPNRHWTDDELMSRCLTAWEACEQAHRRYEAWWRSLLGGLTVAGLVAAVAWLGML